MKNTKLYKQEIEIKLKVVNPRLIHQKLKDIGAKFFGKVFERTVRFDTSDKNLEKRGKFLRIRTGFENTVTFKQKFDNKKFKERKEIELEISDPDKMRMVFESLGFKKIKIMEKYREKWQFGNTEIVIDKLPMGNFIEIEGEKRKIKEMVKILGLNFKDRIIATYWDLWKEFSKKEGIRNENIIFPSIKKNKN